MNRIIYPKIKNYITKKDISLAKKIDKKGGELYIVGGYVRDMLIDKSPRDKDYLVTGLSKEEFKDLFEDAKLVGESFPVFLLEGKEFAFPRIDNSLKKDLKSRDLTINSIAIDILNKHIVYEGIALEDLKEGILRDNILEGNSSLKLDPLRVYRVARFASELDFSVFYETAISMSSLSNRLNNIAPERIFEEFRKVLVSDRPDKFFSILKYINCLNIHFEEIDDFWNKSQPDKYHPEGDVGEHFLQTLKLLPEYNGSEAFRFAVAMHDIGKGLTPKEELPHHYKHDRIGYKALNGLAASIPLPTKWFNAAKLAIEEHQRIKKWREMKPGKVVRLFKRIKRSPLLIDDMVDLVEIDYRARGKDEPLNKVDTNMEGIIDLYYSMFDNTGGEDIDSTRYSGKEFGEQLFQHRCHWLNKKRSEILEGLDE